jgi:hypothetical protein
MTTPKLGYLRKCMDWRFGWATRAAFEKSAGLGPNDYWVESYPGGSALPVDEKGIQYAVSHGAAIFGWQAHGDHCGGQPDVADSEIQRRLDEQISIYKARFPGRHFRIFITEEGVDIKEV